MMVTAKVYCSAKNVQGDGHDRLATVSFQPDYADKANEAWAAATPTLNLTMTLRGDAADHFANGTKYTLTFEPTEVK